jgi:hypothetical protein
LDPWKLNVLVCGQSYNNDTPLPWVDQCPASVPLYHPHPHTLDRLQALREECFEDTKMHPPLATLKKEWRIYMQQAQQLNESRASKRKKISIWHIVRK